jgi:hypothetical protein
MVKILHKRTNPVNLTDYLQSQSKGIENGRARKNNMVYY